MPLKSFPGPATAELKFNSTVKFAVYKCKHHPEVVALALGIHITYFEVVYSLEIPILDTSSSSDF